jgi:hypothetical protein
MGRVREGACVDLPPRLPQGGHPDGAPEPGARSRLVAASLQLSAPKLPFLPNFRPRTPDCFSYASTTGASLGFARRALSRVAILPSAAQPT